MLAALLLSLGQSVWAQDDGAYQSSDGAYQSSDGAYQSSDGAYQSSDTEEVLEARITDIGVCVYDLQVYVKTDSLTQKEDTICIASRPEILWQSENVNVYDSLSIDLAMQPRRAVRRAIVDSGMRQWGNLMEDYVNNFYYYVFRYEYPSVDADGNPIMLSAIAACPTREATKEVRNIIIGTHLTITADSQRPSAQINNFKQDDWGMIFSLAAGSKLVLQTAYGVGATAVFAVASTIAVAALFIPGLGMLLAAPFAVVAILSGTYIVDQMGQSAASHEFNDNLVIMADYEGYGLTKERAHPYLYQELTARQCIDATRYGRDLYEHDAALTYLRHPIREQFRTMSVGYSQGGSVALACQRFIEQNNLVEEFHFAGSYCGDGPYDPIATLMSYVQQSVDGKNLSMPVVLPLIVKGMLDTNPYMVSHKAEDYFRPEFVNTGIFDWLSSKDYTTGDIDAKWQELYDAKKTEKNYKSCSLKDIMNDECYNYFLKLYNDNKDTFTSAEGVPLPKQRGVMEDLHFALASNDVSRGWNPAHTIQLFHSTGDTVVPYSNALKVKNTFGDKVELEDARNKQDHMDSGTDFFKGDSNLDVILDVLNLRMYHRVSDICKRKW